MVLLSSYIVYLASAIYDWAIVIGSVLCNAARVLGKKAVCYCYSALQLPPGFHRKGRIREKTLSSFYFPGLSHVRPEKRFISYLAHVLFCSLLQRNLIWRN